MAGIDSYTMLMLHLNGLQDATTSEDSSEYEHGVTFAGSAKLDQTEEKFGIMIPH